MASYKVLSDNLSAAKQGETVDSAALDGCNIEALVEAGHLAEISAKNKKEITEETDK